MCAGPGLREDAKGEPQLCVHRQGQPHPASRGDHDGTQVSLPYMYCTESTKGEPHLGLISVYKQYNLQNCCTLLLGQCGVRQLLGQCVVFLPDWVNVLYDSCPVNVLNSSLGGSICCTPPWFGRSDVRQLLVGCPSKIVSLRNNRNQNRNQFRHYPKQNFCFGCFASIPKQRVSVFRLNRNKQMINRNKQK